MAESSLRETKKQRTRQRVLEIALEVFHQQGFSGVRMAEVAKRAEISDQTLFNYFPTKEALFEGAVVDWLQGRSPMMEPQLATTALPIEEAFTPPLAEWFRFVDEFRWLLGMAAAHTDLFVPYRRAVPPSIEVNYAVRLERVRELQQQGRIRTDISAERICTLYQAIRDHVVGRWLVSPEQPLAALEEDYRSNFAIFMSGIAAT